MKIKNLIVMAAFFILATSATLSTNKTVALDAMLSKFDNQNFVEFLSHFEKRELPIRIGFDDFKGYQTFINKNNKRALKAKNAGRQSPIYNSDFIPENTGFAFGRMGRPIMQPVARFYPNEKMIAVIFSSEYPFGTGLDNWYSIAYYNMKGEVISSHMNKDNKYSFPIASTSMHHTTTCNIDKNGRIWKNDYENIWKEDLRKTSYMDNEITGFEIKNTAVFEMGKDGLITQLKEIPTAVRACLD